MPHMDGFQVLEELRQREIATPVIVVSADIQESSKNKCMSLGAKNFLVKPTTREAILSEVDRILS